MAGEILGRHGTFQKGGEKGPRQAEGLREAAGGSLGRQLQVRIPGTSTPKPSLTLLQPFNPRHVFCRVASLSGPHPAPLLPEAPLLCVHVAFIVY